MRDFSEKLSSLPQSFGVYLMLDVSREIIYVGKAKNLRNRVRQYFNPSTSKSQKTLQLVEKIDDFRFILTKNELEALILENNLIKEHQPKYNILLKDDKTYPYIKIDLKSDFPTLEITRRLKKDGSKYFGPYMIGISAASVIDLLQNAFSIRNCKGTFKNSKKRRECLNYHIGRCPAPCVGRISSAEYKEHFKNVIAFLNGNDKDVREALENKIKVASDNLEFELALNCRNSLNSLDKLARKQMINVPLNINMDVFAFATNGMFGVINYLLVRGGKVLGSENYSVSEAGSFQDILSNYIVQFYDKNPVIASEIILPENLIFENELKSYLEAKKSSKVEIIVPKAGFRASIIKMAQDNAKEHLENSLNKIANKETLTRIASEKLQISLSIDKPLRRLECFDISNISGIDKVASMVVFINGEPYRKMYRRFKIQTVAGIDDFACMSEVITRRISELTSNDESFADIPDLIIVDGGKGQLSSAYSILKDYNINLIGLAKREEEVFIPLNKDPIILTKNSPELSLLQRIRDEAHRFAITYHRTLRLERQTKSNLLNIPGVGKAKARALLTHFKRIENIINASADEIQQIEGFGKAIATKIYDYFSPKRDELRGTK
ncbi:MAG: excinuclease ABC subunit UvrC [Christensenellaceae bacterium]|jgi:excinuclease ABC subunit C|nr:excinuclease ABC subunit UvrC [Christensenellaceae bacterium]